MNKRPNPAENFLRMLPAKYAILVVGLLIGYFLLQPWLNRQFGWRLPSLAQGTQQEATEPKSSEPELAEPQGSEAKGKEAKGKETQGKETKGKETKLTEPAHSEPKLGEPKLAEPKTSKPVAPASQASESSSTVAKRPEKQAKPPEEQVKESTTKEAPSSKTDSTTTPPTKTSTQEDANKKFGLLTDLGRNRFQSPAGLIYGPGSEEGHRLKHVERHLEDQPDRPGKHGVFDGDMAAAIRLIDDAYQRASRKAKGTTLRDEDGRTVVEANFDKPIGFIGGRDGKRSGNPPARRLRLVIADKNVITAFPF